VKIVQRTVQVGSVRALAKRLENGACTPTMVAGDNQKQTVMTLVKVKQAPVVSTSPVDRLASEIFGQNIARFFGSDGFMDHAPRVNIIENNDEFRVEMLAPGFDKKDLKVEMVDDTLILRGEHTVEDQNEEVRWTRREFSHTSFERSFVLPQSVKADAIKAEYVNGVLKLTIPKSEEAKPKMRTISIQ
jgi:HSP20 family protein